MDREDMDMCASMDLWRQCMDRGDGTDYKAFQALPDVASPWDWKGRLRMC